MGDVSWVVPTVQLYAATWVPGTVAHTWQATAAGGTSIGVKGMLVAAKPKWGGYVVGAWLADRPTAHPHGADLVG